MKLAWLLLLVACVARAQVRDAAFDPHVGAAVPAQLEFREGRLGDYLGSRPVVLVLGYGGCVNLCGTTLTGVDAALRRSGLAADRDYTALFVSIDPRDEAAPPAHRAGWHYLTGAASANALARIVGFRYFYEKESGQFAHPAGFMLLTPRGAVARYFPGVSFAPADIRDGIEKAGRGQTQNAFDRLLLLCFHDPVRGKHSEAVLVSMRIAVGAFLALLVLLAWRKLR